jgi:membrane-associated protease RseP (regulator of RpoE activity)
MGNSLLHAARRVSVPFALLLACVATTGCVSYESIFVGQSNYRLHEARDADGTVRTYDVEPNRVGGPRIAISRESAERKAVLGVTLVELTPERAEQRGARPYAGLLVTEVQPESAAARAGVLVGDVLQKLDGVGVYYRAQYEDVLDRLREGDAVDVVVARGSLGEDEAKLDRRAVEITPKFVERRSESTEYVDLEVVSSRSDKPFAGFQISTLPGELNGEMFGDPRPALMLSQVVVGSPAYKAGLRSGDLVERVDGREIRDADELIRIVQERGRSGGKIDVAVSREPRQVYDATVELTDYSRRTDVRVPLVFGVDSSSRSTRWRFGPFGSVMAYRNEYVESETRESETEGAFSMALGLIRYSWSPDGNSTRLLWLIRFDS